MLVASALALLLASVLGALYVRCHTASTFGGSAGRLSAAAFVTARFYSSVAKAECSSAAKRKASTKRTAAGETCHSLRSLLGELALVIRSTNPISGIAATFRKITNANRTQARALQLVGLDAKRL